MTTNTRHLTHIAKATYNNGATITTLCNPNYKRSARSKRLLLTSSPTTSDCYRCVEEFNFTNKREAL